MFIRRHLFALLAIMIVALSLTSFYFYQKSKGANNAANTEIQSLVKEVAVLVVVPIDETPTLATVSDPSALKGQAFFVDAIEGDKVLIYTNAKKAVLYRPSINKVINIAPLNLGDTQAPPSTQ